MVTRESTLLCTRDRDAHLRSPLVSLLPLTHSGPIPHRAIPSQTTRLFCSKLDGRDTNMFPLAPSSYICLTELHDSELRRRHRWRPDPMAAEVGLLRDLLLLWCPRLRAPCV